MINQKRNHSSKFDQQNNQKNQRNNQKSKIKIKYQGFIPKKDWKIDTVESDICPQLFFEKYVKQRQPVLINNSKNNQMTQFSWNKDYMSKKAGNTEVFIEKRDAEYEQFGTGKQKVKMNFNEFLNLKEDKFKYYMTTQKIPYDSVGPKYLTDGALLNLLEEKDYRPSLIGNLVPNQYNMWMGFSGEKGSSTGLHFDYHDNIYVLVKGKKKFTISCPVNVQELKVNGDVKVVHKNGLIALNSDCQSDGHFSDDSESENEDSRSFQFGQNFNDDMFNLTPKELKKKLNQIQQKINNLKEQIKKNPENIEDLKFQLGEAEQNEEELLDIELGLTLKGEQIIDDFDENEDENLKADIDEDDEQEEPLQEDPDNFVISKLQKVNYHRLCSVFEVIVNEGQMLYLPASWYHQVNSYGEFHFAFNYWMHPPNNDKFEQPYKTQYWENRYKQVKLNTDKKKNELNKNTQN